MYLRLDKQKGYILSILSKDGRGRGQIPVSITLKNKYFCNNNEFFCNLSLMTNDEGDIILG